MVRRRPLPSTGLCLANYEALTENMQRPYPFGLVGVGSAYQDAVHHLFIDHAKHNYVNDLYMIDLLKADQPTPVVNMVNIHQILDDSINDILEESPDAYSEDSTKTVSTCPTFPLGFGGGIFISASTASPEMAKPPTSTMLA